MSALLALAFPLAVTAQQTVFYDTFGSSTLYGVSTPGGTPTASSTSYDVASAKNASATSIAPGNLNLITSATSSGSSEAQAIFSAFPVSLQTTNDYIELDYTFIDSTDVMNTVPNGTGGFIGSGNAVGLYCGLFNSGGVLPLTSLTNTDLGAATGPTTGGTQNWLGYNVAMLYGQTANEDWAVASRPAQTSLTTYDQAVLYNYPTAGAHVNSPNPPFLPFTNLVAGAQYTAQLRITLSAPGQLTVSNALYQGTAVGGSIVYSVIGNFTGANVLATNFDSLAIGYRAGDNNTVGWTNDINNITVIASLAAQAGPYFTLTSSGNGCGGATIGLNGSVSTNVYWLYDNGTNTGQSLPGTGSSISFGNQVVNGVYTIIASNTATMSQGPMYGSQSIFVGTPFFAAEPSSLICVTNIPAAFSVVGVGPSLTYQWYLNGTPVTNSVNVFGAQTTNLSIHPTLAANVGSYYCVAQSPCGDIFTSTPIATLTLIPPNNLVWQGGSDGNWEFTEANFLNQANLVNFTNGDDVTFNDTSGFTTVNVTTNVTSTLCVFDSVNQGYTVSGPGQITGFSEVVDGITNASGLTIANANNYTGGTIVSNGAILNLGTGSGSSGTVAGIITLAPNATLNYNYLNISSIGNDQIQNGFAGSGTVYANDGNGAIILSPVNQVSSNFNGTIYVMNDTVLHASAGNSGDPFGYGSTAYATNPGCQLWLDGPSAMPYNMNLYLNGNGSELNLGGQGASPETGALRIYNCTLTGQIFMTSNSRIGGSINGATIQSVISGPYQLEVYGNTNSFVLVLGPTNGSPQNYTTTLISSGAISCANTNAVSTGLLIEDAGGDFQLNGNNIAVADLWSTNSGNVAWTAGPTVRNNNTTNAAVLTVGSDNGSYEYDGTFLNGAAATLGLTKVGSGTLSLSAVSTNTGPVMVLGGSIALVTGGPVNQTSGTFTKASVIAVGSSASFNVSGRPDNTLTLNSGQKLAGRGTVTGNVVVSSGAALNPGLPTGTLTVSGSVTMNSGSTYLANINRTNSPNDGLLSASGGITYAGTLQVTNVGPALQAGDTFQLFPSANTSFGSIILPTNDVANNLKYTWNNNVTSSGQISVATVSFLVNPFPTNIVATLSGNSLVLSWPVDHTGWTLQVQTNSLKVGLSTNWVNVAGSASVDSVTNSATNGASFYRLMFVQ